MHQDLDNRPLEQYISFQFSSDYLQIEIETERLFIRSYKHIDFENCISLYGDEMLTKYFDHGKARGKTEVENLIFKKWAKYSSEGKPFGLFSIFKKQNMEFIGQIDFLPSEELGVAEIGFILHQQHHNQGFCSEAVKAFIFDYVKEINERNFNCEELPLKKVIATVHPKNESSKKVLQKVGMSIDKIQKRFGQPRLWYSRPVSLIFQNPKVGA